MRVRVNENGRGSKKRERGIPSESGHTIGPGTAHLYADDALSIGRVGPTVEGIVELVAEAVSLVYHKLHPWEVREKWGRSEGEVREKWGRSEGEVREKWGRGSN
jgi:hypothetical protein